MWRLSCCVLAQPDTATSLRAHTEQPIITRTQIAKNLEWIPNFDHKPTPIWKPGAPCGFNAVANFVIKQDALMKHEHRSAVMCWQLKILKKALPTETKENCFIAPHAQNKTTGEKNKWINPENNCAAQTVAPRKADESHAGRKHMKGNIKVRTCTKCIKKQIRHK